MRAWRLFFGERCLITVVINNSFYASEKQPPAGFRSGKNPLPPERGNLPHKSETAARF
jgi:hypothetical protein